MWSEKPRQALDAMEGDTEKTKISYFHHWIDEEGMGKIESWKDKKFSSAKQNMIDWRKVKKKARTLQKKTESYFTLFESMLAPMSNALLAAEEQARFYGHVVKTAKRCKFPCAKTEEKAI